MRDNLSKEMKKWQVMGRSLTMGKSVDLRQSTIDRRFETIREILNDEKGVCVVEHEREFASHEKGTYA